MLWRSDEGYRGVDRRDSVESGSATDRTWMVGGVILCALLVGFGWMSVDGDLGALALAVRSSGLVLAGVLAVASLLHWRATGEAAGYFAATAASLIAVGIVSEMVYPTPAAGWFLLCAVPAILAAIWMGRAIMAPAVDSTTGPIHQAMIAALSLLSFWGTATGLAVVLEVPLRTLAALLYLGTAAVWGVVAVLGLLQAVRGTSALRSWMAWMAVCLASSLIAYLLGFIQADSWRPLGDALRLSGLAIGVVGVSVALSRNAIGQREALYRASLSQRNERRRRAESDRERAHEVGTALLAIEGATATLERHRDLLDPPQRSMLARAVRTGMEDLRSLTLVQVDAVPRRLIDVVADHVALARARGLRVGFEAPVHLDVEVDVGMLGQVLNNLFVNAELHGGRDGPVTIDVAVQRVEGAITITVSDDGPGIAPELLERIFERDFRADPAADGQGIGLAVARRLVRQQGGDLTARATRRGACFQVRLPEPAATSELLDEPQQLRDVGEVADAAGASTSNQTSATRARPAVQYHHQLGSRLWRLRRHDRKVEDPRRDRVVQDDRDVGHLIDENAEAVAQQRRGR